MAAVGFPWAKHSKAGVQLLEMFCLQTILVWLMAPSVDPCQRNADYGLGHRELVVLPDTEDQDCSETCKQLTEFCK